MAWPRQRYLWTAQSRASLSERRYSLLRTVSGAVVAECRLSRCGCGRGWHAQHGGPGAHDGRGRLGGSLQVWLRVKSLSSAGAMAGGDAVCQTAPRDVGRAAGELGVAVSTSAVSG
jgi:hypothetical protein